MGNYVKVGNLQVAELFYEFMNNEVLPGSDLDTDRFWADFEALVKDLTPKNKALLARRDEIQEKLNEWYKEHRGNIDFAEYKTFLTEIGYLEPEVDDFTITTEGVDDEIAVQAGPQLVVPITNARYALNAANARWGSLYDALYGTDAISEEDGAERGNTYNPVRGEKVIAYAREFLDQAVPLNGYSHKDAVKYAIVDGKLSVSVRDGHTTVLQDEAKFVGYQGKPEDPSAILLKNNGLHIEIQIDRDHPIGKTDAAGIKDIYLEAALTTIMDCEDSVAAVDAEDKVLVYRNLLGLIKGDLTATFTKGNKTVTRALNPDRTYQTPSGEEITLPGRSLMFVRNVGHLMTNNTVLDHNGEEVYEGIIDAVVTSLIMKHSLIGNCRYPNSRKGSIYIVKPKMHGSEEVAFANELFDRVEDMLGLKRNTIKIGVMDEERRTTLNLKKLHLSSERPDRIY